jgi:uncharacterized protein YggE
LEVPSKFDTANCSIWHLGISKVFALRTWKVVEAVVNAGNENVMINGIVPFITKGSAAMEDARAAAVADAKSRAVSYAKLLGTSLGKVVYLQENSAPSYSFPMLGVAKAQADSSTPEIDLGEEEVTVTITVRWALN